MSDSVMTDSEKRAEKAKELIKYARSRGMDNPCSLGFHSATMDEMADFIHELTENLETAEKRIKQLEAFKNTFIQLGSWGLELSGFDGAEEGETRSLDDYLQLALWEEEMA